MAETRLILHVAGTDAETQELPKEAVKTAVAEGKLSYSQLIWSPVEQTWKQVRELPDLLPGESLILHVKGTEGETREMPKQAVKNAISRGEITRSQLIWSATDGTWKPVREIPDLLPGETLILHVKGTEGETRELPKPAIRAAIQKGEISQSQLIWSPLDTAWKPVSQMPELQPGESLVLHVKGTTAETKEMPKQAIRTEIKEGKITHSQLIWSAEENRWKQVRELPELLPSQKLAPAPPRRSQVAMPPAVGPDYTQNPVARAATPVPRPAVKAKPNVVAPPRVTITPSGAHEESAPAVAQPKVAEGQVPVARAVPVAVPRVADGSSPKVVQAPRAVAAVARPQVAGGPNEGHVVREEDHGFRPVKWICIGLSVILAVVVLANYLLIDRPLSSNLSGTPFSNVFVFGHYGAFIQPNVIVIHVPRSSHLTPDNLGAFLIALAHSTPKNPLTGENFDRIAITSSWMAQYSFSGLAWQHLGDMTGQTNEDDIRTQILGSGFDAGGVPLLGESTLNSEAQEARRIQMWSSFVADFTTPSAK